MPRIWAGDRRRLLVILVFLGVLQAVLAVLMATTVEALLRPLSGTDRWDIAAAFACVVGIGAARWIERVMGEEVGQNYVFEQRRRLITSAIGDTRNSSSLGVTVTRASNDLSAVRNWIALGVVPLLTGIPLIVLVVGALFVLDWHIGLAVAIPLAVVAALVPVLARITLARARDLRRHRGRMSAKVADTVLAGESIRASGAVTRELKAIDRGSGKVVAAAVDRAWITGLTRSLTATAASLCTLAVVLTSVLGFTEAATVASTMMLLGILATPVTDLGRVIEYRQNYRAAARILAPLLERANGLKERERRREQHWDDADDVPDAGEATVTIKGLIVEDRRLEDLHAVPGDRIQLFSADPHQIRATVSTLTSLDTEDVMVIGDLDYGLAPGRGRRELLGVASHLVPLERGSVARLAGFRAPDASESELLRILDRVGLKPVIDRDPRGLRLKLKNGGQPWSSSEVMQLKLARSLLRSPPLLVLEGADVVLDGHGIVRLKVLLDEYPGVVLFSSPHPDLLCRGARRWNVDGEEVDGEEVDAEEWADEEVDADE